MYVGLKTDEREIIMTIRKSGAIPMYFSIIYRHGKIMHDNIMKEFDLTGQQMGYLRYINDNRGVSQEQLAKNLHIDKGAVAKAIKDMMDKGYIERKRNPHDKRAYCLFPAEKSIEICRRGSECSMEFEKKITRGLTEDEVETFSRLLGRVTDNIREMLEGERI